MFRRDLFEISDEEPLGGEARAPLEVDGGLSRGHDADEPADPAVSVVPKRTRSSGLVDQTFPDRLGPARLP
jgi:hypothetical protein